MALQTDLRADSPATGAQRLLPRRPVMREMLAVAAVLLVACALRLVLAARAWPLVNSDEATLGLMADDILWHGAHPAFFYGQHYMGALQAYLAAPVFAVLGPTVFAIHVVTTAQFALFALVLYIFTRMVYSPPVAWLSLALLAFGPPGALFNELRAGAGTQDTLLFGALLLWLTLVRLRHPERPRTRLALDAAIGLAAGLGLWGDFLILPFMAASGAALALDGLLRQRERARRARARAVATRLLTLALGFGIGAAPFIAANVASHGATFTQALSKTGVNTSSAHPAIVGALATLPQQVVATVFEGIPHLLGSGVLCPRCAIWPAPHYQGTAGAALVAVLIALPFIASVTAVWTLAALATWRDLRVALRAGRRQGGHAVSERPAPLNIHQWGRALLVAAAGLTVLAYVVSPVSFNIPAGSGRYLVGLYVCVPLVAAPLWRGMSWLWSQGARLATWRDARRWRPLGVGVLVAGSLVVIVALSTSSVAGAFGETRDRGNYGIPAGARATRLMAFLASHHDTSFYTTYWVCNDIIFESAERLRCAVVSNDNAFAEGLNRVEGNWTRLRTVAHPAYVFDAQADIGLPAAEPQVAGLVARGDPRFAGYRAVTVAGYDVFYYAG